MGEGPAHEASDALAWIVPDRLEPPKPAHRSAPGSTRSPTAGRAPRHLAAVVVLLFGAGAAVGGFVVERAANQHANDLLLEEDASQAALVLRSLVGTTPPEVTALARGLGPETTQGTWEAAAGPVAAHEGYDAVAAVDVRGGRLELLASTGPVHTSLGAGADEALAAELGQGRSPAFAVSNQGGARWFETWIASPGAPGYALEIERSVPRKPVPLGSLPGRPFSGIEGAVYAGFEAPQDLVLATTSHLPLVGERAVVEIAGNGRTTLVPSRLAARPGAVRSPGALLLVAHPTTSLAGTSSAALPWILLAVGVSFTVAVAGLLVQADRRKDQILDALARLEARNADLDRLTRQQRLMAARFSAIVRSSSDLTVVVGRDGVIRYHSPSSATMLGIPDAALLGRGFEELVHPDDRELWGQVMARAHAVPGAEVREDLRLRAADGSYRSVETTVVDLLADPDVAGVVVNGRDVTERTTLEAELAHQALHDSLTGLANRALFEDHLEHALARVARQGGTVGVVFLGLDDFTAINDGRGHQIGNQVLVQVGHRLREVVRSGDTLARLGGDEYAIVVEGDDDTDVYRTAERAMAVLQAPLVVGTREERVRASIGVVTTAATPLGAQDMLRAADVALYAAKKAGKGRIEVFQRGHHGTVIDRLQLELDLARALERDELVVQYQPVVDLDSGAVVGMEALVRWRHPRRGMVLPSAFIPLAESTGLVVAIGAWVLERACRDVQLAQRRANRPDLHVAVNLSPRQLDDAEVVGQVRSALERSGLPPSSLTLEITESVFARDTARATATVAQLRALGVQLSIDDFGTGYSALGYLSRLPVDELKIDRTFVEAMDDDDSLLVQRIVQLARDRGLRVVAEGIETAGQLERLRQAGCRLGQGYLFSRPTDLDAFPTVPFSVGRRVPSTRQ